MSSIYHNPDIGAEYRDKAIKFFQEEVEESPHSKYYFAFDQCPLYPDKLDENGVYTFKAKSAGCHAGIPTDNYSSNQSFRKEKHCYTLASGFSVSHDLNEEASALWDFMTGPNSPWKAVKNVYPYEGNIEPIYSNTTQRQIGFVLSEAVLNSAEVPWNFIKNFCIACRMPMETPNKLKLWYHLVSNYGLSGADAYIIVSKFQYYSDKTMSLYDMSSGGHWPITFCNTKYSDFVAGHIIVPNYQNRITRVDTINGFWKTSTIPSKITIDRLRQHGHDYEADSLSKIFVNPDLKGSASGAFGGSVVSIDKVLEAFQKWKEDDRIG